MRSLSLRSRFTLVDVDIGADRVADAPAELPGDPGNCYRSPPPTPPWAGRDFECIERDGYRDPDVYGNRGVG